MQCGLECGQRLRSRKHEKTLGLIIANHFLEGYKKRPSYLMNGRFYVHLNMMEIIFSVVIALSTTYVPGRNPLALPFFSTAS